MSAIKLYPNTRMLLNKEVNKGVVLICYYRINIVIIIKVTIKRDVCTHP